jgi:hypothetical protein
MIDEIIRHIDNNSELSAKFNEMASEAFDTLELAEAIPEWFDERYCQDVVVKPTFGADSVYDRQLADLFKAILSKAIDSITSEQWLAIAEHVSNKYWSERSK